MMDDDKKPTPIDNDNPLASFETVTTAQPTAKRPKLHRNTRTLIVATAIMAVLAILVAVLLPLLNTPTGGSDTSSATNIPEEVYPLYDHAKDDTDGKIVQSVAIDYAGDSYTVYYDQAQGVYLLRGYEDIRLGSSVDELIDCATTLNAYDRINTTANLADFGLDKPTATATITYHDGSLCTVHIGNPTPDENGRYIRLADSDTVYMLDIDTAGVFRQAKTSLVERTILAAPSAKKDDKNGSAVLKQLTVTGGPSGQTLTIRQSEASDGMEYSYAPLIIVKPYTRMVDETISTTLQSFTYIIASDAAVLHPSDADKASYGFNNPYATLDITLAVQSVIESETDDDEQTIQYYNTVHATLIVGSQDEDGNYYVMIDDHNAIYRVASLLLSPIVERSYENTVSKLLFLKNIGTVGQLDVTLNGTAHTLAITHNPDKENSDDQLTVHYNNTTLGTPDFRRLYSQMMGLSRYGKADSEPTGQAQYSMALRNTDGSLFLAMEFYKQSASLYTVRTTEGELFTMKSSTIDNWMAQFNNYLAGKGVADI